MRRGLKVTIGYLALAVAIAVVALSRAECAEAAPLPTITGHSERSFSVYQGDQLSVEVQASGEAIQAKWLKDRRIFCRELHCTIDTRSWDVGLHRLTFVIYNKAGSQSLRYEVRILPPPEGRAPTAVHPPLTLAEDAVEAVNAYDLTVKTVRGRAYSYHHNKLQVLGPEPRAIEWAESLRTNASSLLEFGRVGSEAHILASRSLVQLLTADDERRIIVVKRGTLRSRNLSSKDPRWSIVIPGLAQIDTDADGDILVTRGRGGAKDEDVTTGLLEPDDDQESGADDEPAKEAASKDAVKDFSKESERYEAEITGEDTSDGRSGPVTITVLRGQARVFIRSGEQDSGDNAGTAVDLAAGLSLTLGSGEDAKPGLPEVRATGALIVETSPQYLAKYYETGLGEALAFTNAHAQTKSLQAALTAAKEQHHDHIRVLELLLARQAEGKTNYEVQLALGEAYAGLYLQKSATAHLLAAIKLKPEAPEPEVALGELKLLTREWASAERHLEAALRKGHPDSQRLEYELGVAASYRHELSYAHRALTRSLWAEDRPELTTSATAFARRLEARRWYALRGQGGLFYDTNILRSDRVDPAALNTGMTTRRGAGYQASAGFSLWPWRSDRFITEFSFDDAKTGYLAKGFSPLAVIDQHFALRFGLGFGGGSEKPQVVRFGLELQARSLATGGQRALDAFQTIATVSSPWLWQLRLELEVVRAVDPLPARLILIDPLSSELVQPGDRSAHQLYYRYGVTPVATEHWQLELSGRSGRTNYTADFESEESFKDQQLGFDLRYGGRRRSIWSFSMRQNKRSFFAASDGRKDTTLSGEGRWQYAFTPVFSQTVSAGYDKQQSSRDERSYRRQVLTYQLGLNL